MYKIDFVPPQPSGIQEKKHVQIHCAQCYQSGSDPIKMTQNWRCLAYVSKTLHEIVRRQELLSLNESQAIQRINSAGLDSMGNASHNVALPYSYSTRAEWYAAFTKLGLL